MQKGPSQYCDLVMKGGITSGVIYPATAYALSQKYSFKNIGGTSAGAIAAAVVAAAELGRRTGNRDGQAKAAFDVVQGLSADLAQDGRLLKLFTPDSNIAKAFKVALDTLKRKSAIGKAFAATFGVLAAALLWSSLCFLAGLALPTVLFAIAKWHSLDACGRLISSHPFVCFFAGAPLGFMLALIASIASSVVKTIKALAANGFGMCSGMARASNTDLSLTEWIDQQIQSAAGRSSDGKPVTFGDLWDAPLYENEELKTDRTINLEVVTTNLTEGRPNSIPFLDGALYFDPAELGTLFPKKIVEALCRASAAADETDATRPAENKPKKPPRQVSSPSNDSTILTRLPDSRNLPILVATRMSLSFPALLSAIPLYRVDYTIERNQDDSYEKYKTRVGTKVWFSDGGICSNFPINFFDSPIPRWPTFGINLVSAPVTKCSSSDRPAPSFVSMLPPARPARIIWNNLGDAMWTPTGPVEPQKPLDCIVRFTHAIFNTMQNWRDNLQATAPGYRDRIVSVELCSDEGGLNLNMPDSLITRLTQRGTAAAQALNAFDFSQHMFTRFRISLCALDKYLSSVDDDYSNPIPQGETGWEYIKAVSKPPYYQWTNPGLASDAARALIQIHDMRESWQRTIDPKHPRFCQGVPKPTGDLQIRPDF